MAWTVAWIFLFRPTPRPLHAWRCLLLRCFGATIGKRVRVYQSAKIWAPWNLTMADDSVLGDYVDCYCVAPVNIGKHAVISQYSFLCTASHDYNDVGHPLVVAPIDVGEHAWVTADVFIAPGVVVGEGAVVQVRSVVLKDVEPWSLAGGHPAKLLKQRVKAS